MSKEKPKSIKRENYLQFSGNTEKPIKIERDVAKELRNKDWMDQTVSSFEKSLGFAPTKKEIGKKIYKTRIFDPSVPKEADLLCTLFNSEKHKITYWKDNWTALGEYRVFVVYYELQEDEEIKK